MGFPAAQRSKEQQLKSMISTRLVIFNGYLLPMISYITRLKLARQCLAVGIINSCIAFVAEGLISLYLLHAGLDNLIEYSEKTVLMVMG